MKFDEILNKYGKNERLPIYNRLILLGNRLLGKNKWEFDNTYDSETITLPISREYSVKIGENNLTDGCDNDEYNLAGYVQTVLHMFHEERHVQQFIREWNTTSEIKSIKNISRTTDIIRREFISIYFPSLYENIYSDNPSEIDAELYAVRSALGYFRSDPIISEQKAEEALFDLVTSDDYVHKKLLDRYELRTVDDVISALDTCCDDAINHTYNIVSEKSAVSVNSIDTDTDITDRFLTDPKFRLYRREFYRCENGIQQDKILEQVILFEYGYPDVAKTVPRLREELRNCDRQMGSYMFKPKTHPIPHKMIKYAKNGSYGTDESASFTEGVAAIPTENTDDLKA